VLCRSTAARKGWVPSVSPLYRQHTRRPRVLRTHPLRERQHADTVA
jgi:hypothetical protein